MKCLYNSKHLTYDDRLKIQEGIYNRNSKSSIASSISKSPSTIGKEIKKHRKLKPRNYSMGNETNCVFLSTCKVCYNTCADYKEPACISRDRTVGACNGCPSLAKCRLNKYFYTATYSQNSYINMLKDSREGVNLNNTELLFIARTIKPLINQGQSLYTIIANHPELKISVKTLYTYIAIGLFREWDIYNLSLKRKVKRKIKSKKLKKRAIPANFTSRTYEDYLEFIAKNKNVVTTEMDTVYNNQAGPYIQTFIFQNTGLMIGRLHSKKTPEYMASSIDYFEKLLETDFKKLFSVLLTDRGTEFYKPELFETKAEKVDDTTIRCNLFYCDPQTPSQKPHVENNHNFVREILPNGMDWTNLTQEKVDLMFSHINSVTRYSLGGKSPYEVFSYIYNEDILTKLNIRKIEKDKVTLKPHLLK